MTALQTLDPLGLDAADIRSLVGKNDFVYNKNPTNMLKWRRGRNLMLVGEDAFGGSDKARNAKIAFIGDSTPLGLGGLGGPVNNSLRNALPRRLAHRLKARGLNAFGENLFGTGNISRPTYDARVVLGGWGPDAGATAGGFNYVATAAATFSFTPDEAFDTIILKYPCYSGGGSFSCNVDGGASLGTLSNNSGTQLAVSTFTVPLGTHTINLPWVSGNALFSSIEVYNSATKGVMVANMGRSGAKSTDLLGTSTPWDTLNALKAWAPDLTFIMIGINDGANSVSPATFTTSVQTMITAAQISGSVALMTTIPSQLSSISQATQDGINNAIRALAIANNIPLYDLNARLVDWLTSNSIDWMADAFHGTGRLYADNAEWLAADLMGN